MTNSNGGPQIHLHWGPAFQVTPPEAASAPARPFGDVTSVPATGFAVSLGRLRRPKQSASGAAAPSRRGRASARPGRRSRRAGSLQAGVLFHRTAPCCPAVFQRLNHHPQARRLWAARGCCQSWKMMYMSSSV